MDYEQSLGRVLRANHLKKNLYIHLIVEGCDKDCHDAIMSGVDFQEKINFKYMTIEDVKKERIRLNLRLYRGNSLFYKKYTLNELYTIVK